MVIREALMDREAESIALEKKHVKDVYEKIAKHFTDKRYKAWPQVKEFLMGLEPGSVVADIGCGSGKYLNINKNIHMVGSDCCCKLADISRANGHEVVVCDNLNLPYRDNCFDAVISIAVIHHFATVERRVQALQELARICRPGGLLMIYVWAMEQKQRKFDAQDVLVPWHLPQRHSKYKCMRNKTNGECLSQRSSSFTMGYQDQQSKNQAVFSLPSEGISSSDSSPVESPQHSGRHHKDSSYPHSQSKVLTKCLSDVSFQSHSKSLPSMQEPALCAPSSAQSLSDLNLLQDAESSSSPFHPPPPLETMESKNEKDRGTGNQSKEIGTKALYDDLYPAPSLETMVSQNKKSQGTCHEGKEEDTNTLYDDSYIDISFDKKGGVVRQRLFRGLPSQDGFLSEDGIISESLILKEGEAPEREELGGSLQNLGRFEMNPLLTVMRSLAHLEKSLSLPETELENGGSSKHKNDLQLSNGHYKDLRILQLTSKQGSCGTNSVCARGESFLKRTRGQVKSGPLNHQNSRDSSMESLSSSDDSITAIPLDTPNQDAVDACKVHLERCRNRRTHGLHRTSRSVPGSPHVLSTDSSCFFGQSKIDAGDAHKGDFSKYLRYYHVFREGELVELIDQHVPTLHVVKDFFDHANWCVVAEKVQCWTI